MSGNDELSSDEERHFEDDESSEGVVPLSFDNPLFPALNCNDAAAAVQRALQDGANVNAARDDTTPLLEACRHGFDQIVRLLLDAGADARWTRRDGSSAAMMACFYGHLSTVQLLINHDNGLLEMTNNEGWTPLLCAVYQGHVQIVRFLLDCGADVHASTDEGFTTQMYAVDSSPDIVRMLLAAGVDVEARDGNQRTALHHAVRSLTRDIEAPLELILHNANIFAVDTYGNTPFDGACDWLTSDTAVVDCLLEVYADKLVQYHGRLALHELLRVAKYSFADDEDDDLFHPPLNPLRIILPLGKLTLKHLRTLLHTLDPELIRNRDDAGKLPIHIACRTNAPVQVLALILELDPAVLHMADSTGALPIHLLCGSTTAATEYGSVPYLVEQGGVGTLSARNRQGLLPLHVLCGSGNPPLRTVQYLIESFSVSLAMQTNAGQYPFMMAAAAEADSALESLSVVYELVRANPGLVVPR